MEKTKLVLMYREPSVFTDDLMAPVVLGHYQADWFCMTGVKEGAGLMLKPETR